MIASQDFNGNRYLCVLLSLLVTWHLAHAKNVQHSSTYCNQVLDERAFTLVQDEEINKLGQQLQLYEFAYVNKVFHESCVIAGNKSLRIGFERITKVSEILIHQTAFNAKLNSVKVSIWRGATSVECKLSGSFIELPNGKFASFNCLNNDAINSISPTANAIEITGLPNRPDIKVNLVYLKDEGLFDWLYLVQRTADNIQLPGQCLPPGLHSGQKLNPEKRFYSPGENVTFVCPDDSVVEPWDAQRTCQTNGHWSNSTPKCQPKRQWYAAIPGTNQVLVPTASNEEISLVAHFNKDFYNITDISIDFEFEFNEDEWERYFMEQDNAMIYISDSNNNILKMGSLPHRQKGDTEWNSITMSEKNFINGHPCTNCTVGITFRKYHWQVPVVKKIRIFGSTFHQGMAYRNGITKQCPPITPYFGMPEKYMSYELILDGSINELLLTSPCLEGFKFVGKRSEISQCKDGTWQGLGLPICEEIALKSPPEVEHASWIYVQDDGQHKAVYICENGYYVTGKGNKATYSIENDDWIDVPGCQREALYLMRDYWPVTLLIAFSLVAALVAAYPTYKWIRNRRLHRNMILMSTHPNDNFSRPSSTLVDGEGYVIPSKTKLPWGELSNSSNVYSETGHSYEVIPQA